MGVDVDQNYIGANGVEKDGYAYNPFITSAMKGLSESVSTALGDIEAGEWSNIAATNGNFGLEDGDYIGLPTADDSWNPGITTVIGAGCSCRGTPPFLYACVGETGRKSCRPHKSNTFTCAF